MSALFNGKPITTEDHGVVYSFGALDNRYFVWHSFHILIEFRNLSVLVLQKGHFLQVITRPTTG